jgi:hypothetical protein
MQLDEHNRIQSIWVLHHKGIDGNETAADQLIKQGSEHPFIGPKPACGISLGVVVRDWIIRDYRKQWNSLN